MYYFPTGANLIHLDRMAVLWCDINPTQSCKNKIYYIVKRGRGNVMDWECMAQNRMGKLHFIDGILDAKEYLKLLQSNLNKSAEQLNLEKKIFQQDNEHKHCSWMVRNECCMSVLTHYI